MYPTMSPYNEQDIITYLLFTRSKKAELKAKIKEISKQRRQAQKSAMYLPKDIKK